MKLEIGAACGLALLLAACNQPSKVEDKAGRSGAAPAASAAPRAIPAPTIVKPAALRPGTPAELKAAFRLAFGRDEGAVRKVKSDSGEVEYAYTPAELYWAGDQAILVSSGKSADCHGCTGALAIHYLRRGPNGLVLTGSWPEIVPGTSWGLAPSWKLRADLTPHPALQTERGGTWQGYTCTWADLIELTPERPIVRLSGLETGYSDSGSDQAKGVGVDGEIKPGERGRTLTVEYAGETGHGPFKQAVPYALKGEAYAPTVKAQIPEC